MKKATLFYGTIAFLAVSGSVISILLLANNYYPGFSRILSCVKNCEIVSSSQFSSIAGIPLPVYGLYFFITVLIIETGCILYGKEALITFIAIMFVLYSPAALACIILGIVLLYYKTPCLWCISIYFIVLLSYGITTAALLQTGQNRNIKKIIPALFGLLKRKELRPAVFFMAIIMLMLVPALSCADAFIKKTRPTCR
jgi:uncharacterized membrane protein